jgi:ABC-type nitrate/sulfonate/bicarbonate transport system substrate-binding protein
VTIALDWTANVNYLGLYAAIANGTFAEHGIEPVILPFAGTPAETLIGSGKADLAISFPPDIVINRARGGLRYRAVAALVAHNTTALAVLESSPYRRPAELDGKLYGGFGLQSDPPLIRAIMRATASGTRRSRRSSSTRRSSTPCARTASSTRRCSWASTT